MWISRSTSAALAMLLVGCSNEGQPIVGLDPEWDDIYGILEIEVVAVKEPSINGNRLVSFVLENPGAEFATLWGAGSPSVFIESRSTGKWEPYDLEGFSCGGLYELPGGDSSDFCVRVPADLFPIRVGVLKLSHEVDGVGMVWSSTIEPVAIAPH